MRSFARSVFVPMGMMLAWLGRRIDMPTLFAIGEPVRPEAPHPWAAQLPYFAKDRR